MNTTLKIIKKRSSVYLIAWLAAVALALVLAFASPNESRVMGQLPVLLSKTLTQQSLSLPEGLPSDRTLALITFSAEQRAQAESWIEGLNLKNDTGIAWVRMPVVSDPGTHSGRSEVENRLLQRYPAITERAKLMPIFTNRDDFVRSASLNGVAQSYAVVINRKGDVLARVEGKFDAEKAQILRETLRTGNPQ